MKRIFGKPFLIALVALAVLFAVLNTAQGQGGSTFGGIMNYDPASQWVQFTDRTGTWHAPLAIHNSAAPSNSVTEFVVNTDDQFEIQTFHVGNLAAYLDLDTDGSVELYGSGGGGIGAEGATGDTCLPASVKSPCGPNSIRIATNGTIKQYLGQPTMGHGISTIQYYADASLTGSFGPYTIFNTNTTGYASSGMYRLSGYIVATSTQTGATMEFHLGYTDETGLQLQSTPSTAFGVNGNKVPFSFVFYSAPGTPVTITTVASGTPVYGIHLRLEAL